MSYLFAIPGMESLNRLDEEAAGDTNVNVVVGAPEEVAEQVIENEKAAEQATEVQEAEVEADETEATGEELEQMCTKLEAHAAYLRQYGYPREFAMLANHDNFYGAICGRFTGHSLPSLESLSATANPYD